jgi:hypothetical protein
MDQHPYNHSYTDLRSGLSFWNDNSAGTVAKRIGLRIAKQLKPNIDFVKARLSRAFTKSIWDVISFRVLRRIPAKNLPFEPVPFDCAQDTGNDERAERSRSQRVYSFGETP